jgi:tripartite-type tricarboxylate transporter receptor subunit TctC
VQAFFSGTPQFSPFIKGGRLRVIAASTPKPNRIMPDVPTVSEIFPGFDCNTWYGIFAPAGTPAELLTRFNTELTRALNDPGLVQRLLDQGIEAMPGSAASLRQMITSETERWRKVIKAARITVQAVQ